MGSISIVHGIIKVSDIEQFETVLNSLDYDENYPWINKEMINLCGKERPYFYEEPVATFGATYKNLDGGTPWKEFILKFEYILEQIKFDFARLRLETEFMGDYEFFWGAKKSHSPKFYTKAELVETEKWFFGLGKRHMFGGLEEEEPPEAPHQFEYPIEFNQATVDVFNSFLPELNEIELYKRTYFENQTSHKVLGNDHSHLILTHLKLHKFLDFGWEQSKGFFITRKKEVPVVSTPYNNG